VFDKERDRAVESIKVGGVFAGGNVLEAKCRRVTYRKRRSGEVLKEKRSIMGSV
jgi:hypothetical protein